jgi:diguanylate cyclase (GGDEF)-like protein/PAS domain S-box-containing protein
MAFFPNTNSWASHSITVFFVTIVATVTSFAVLRREERLRLEMAASEESYKLLFERCLTGAYRATPDGRILDCNVSFCQMFGYTSREQVIDHSTSVGYFSPEDRVRFIQRLQAAKTVTNFEQRLRRRDGSDVWVLNSASLVASENGSGPVIKGTLTDITELRNAEQQNHRLAAIVGCSDDAILSLTIEGVIETWNRGAERIYGYTSEEAIGRSIEILAPANRSNEFRQILEKIGKGQEVAGIETIRVRKDGRHISIALSVSPLTDVAGVVVGASSISQDITDRKRVEEALRKSEIQYRLLFESNPFPMWVFDRKTLRFLAVNEAAIQQYGYSKQEFQPMTVADIRPEEDVPDLLQDIEKRIHGLEKPGVWRHRKKSGTIIDVEIVCHRLDFQGIDAMLVAAYDITERKQAEEAVRRAEEKYRTIFEDSVIGIFQVTPEGRPVSINRALAQMHGFESPDELMAQVSNVAEQLFVDPSRMIEIGHTVAKHGAVHGAEVEVYGKNRTHRWMSVNVRGIQDPAGNLVLFEGTVEDITDRKAAEERVQFLAYYDALTELPHRALLQDRLGHALADVQRRNEKIALLFLDLDRFKIINDSLGHSFGDIVLKEVAGRLKGCTRAQDTLARVGGDEFLIMLNGVEDVSDAAIAADRVMKAMSGEFLIQGRSLAMSCSIGISMFPKHGTDGETLIKNADAAMYSAKNAGCNNVRFFTAEMNAQAADRLALESNLRQALDKGEFFLVYQPQMEIATRKIVGFEALIRWQHPELGLIPPDSFIPIAEDSGLILQIGEWVLRTACTEAQAWWDSGLCPVPVAVNVSAAQFRQADFPTLVHRALQETGLSPQFLELELTESLLLSNSDMMFSVLQELKKMGLKLAIDDFGTGYSSLSYLKQFRVNRLKIDCSFIRDIATDSDDAAITAAIISMAKSLNLKVIAEGVETEAQMAFLREHHCDEIQGYYFSKPISTGEVADKLLFARTEQNSALSNFLELQTSRLRVQ